MGERTTNARLFVFRLRIVPRKWCIFWLESGVVIHIVSSHLNLIPVGCFWQEKVGLKCKIPHLQSTLFPPTAHRKRPSIAGLDGAVAELPTESSASRCGSVERQRLQVGGEPKPFQQRGKGEPDRVACPGASNRCTSGTTLPQKWGQSHTAGKTTNAMVSEHIP